MKKWTSKNTWDQIIERLDEFEGFKLPFNIKRIRKITNGNKTILEVSETNDPAIFSYSIENYYPTIKIWFANSNIRFEKDLIALAEVDKNFSGKRQGRNVFTNKKDAMIYCLNIWENYMNRKQYLKDKILFDKWCEKIDKKEF